MLKAGALIYAIFISFLLSVICGLLIVFSLTYNKTFISEFKKGELINNVYSGVNLVLYTNEIFDFNNSLTIDLYNDTRNIVELKKKEWGAYEIIDVKSSWANFVERRIALTGIDWRNNQNIALYLADHNNYLFIAGKTVLKGDCFVPGAQIKTTGIDGNDFKGIKSVEGEIYKSTNELPAINQDFVSANSKYLENLQQINDSSFIISAFNNQSDIIHNSFFRKTLILYEKDDILINKKEIKGNVIIKSETSVEIFSDSYIEDAIIYAPEVIVHKGFEGSLQIFANSKIIIDKNCELKYPSFICTINDNSEIIVSEDCVISGGILLFLTDQQNGKQSGIDIKKNTIIMGQVYSNGYVQHNGVLIGSLYCENLILKTKASLYENHLLDATINLSDLSESFVGTSCLFEKSNRKIIDWLN